MRLALLLGSLALANGDANMACPRRITFDFSSQINPEVSMDWLKKDGTPETPADGGGCGGTFNSATPGCPGDGVPFAANAEQGAFPDGIMYIRNVGYDGLNQMKPVDLKITVATNPHEYSTTGDRKAIMEYNLVISNYDDPDPASQARVTPQGFCCLGYGLKPAKCDSGAVIDSSTAECPANDPITGYATEFLFEFIDHDTQAPVKTPFDAVWISFFDVDGDEPDNGLSDQEGEIITTKFAGNLDWTAGTYPPYDRAAGIYYAKYPLPGTKFDAGTLDETTAGATLVGNGCAFGTFDVVADPGRKTDRICYEAFKEPVVKFERLIEYNSVWDSTKVDFKGDKVIQGVFESSQKIFVAGSNDKGTGALNVNTDFAKNPHTYPVPARTEPALATFRTNDVTSFNVAIGGQGSAGKMWVDGLNPGTTPPGALRPQNDRGYCFALAQPDPQCHCDTPCPTECVPTDIKPDVPDYCALNPTCPCPKQCKPCAGLAPGACSVCSATDSAAGNCAPSSVPIECSTHPTCDVDIACPTECGPAGFGFPPSYCAANKNCPCPDECTPGKPGCLQGFGPDGKSCAFTGAGYATCGQFAACTQTTHHECDPPHCDTACPKECEDPATATVADCAKIPSCPCPAACIKDKIDDVPALCGANPSCEMHPTCPPRCIPVAQGGTLKGAPPLFCMNNKNCPCPQSCEKGPLCLNGPGADGKGCTYSGPGMFGALTCNDFAGCPQSTVKPCGMMPSPPPFPPPFPPLPCLGWCNENTCGKEECAGCSTCETVAGGKFCAGWCNQYTCASEHELCAGCPVCSVPASSATCHPWCSAYTCFGSCASCSVCGQVREGDYCASWCNAYTCGGIFTGLCGGCSECKTVESGKYCASWCNAYTCGGLFSGLCGGCSACM